MDANGPERPCVLESDALGFLALLVHLGVAAREDDTLGAGQQAHARPGARLLGCQREGNLAPLVFGQVKGPGVAEVVGWRRCISRRSGAGATSSAVQLTANAHCST
jgi:hypothetical protein